MPNPPTKPPSPSELAKLEHAFATDPSSDAYRPLAEAYLSASRFMEAMVVCKKGVKTHPNAVEPRLLLARVYQQQGKDRKALEESLAALQIAPADKVTLRMTADLHFKLGEAEAGRGHLLKAYELDSRDGETMSLMGQWKVEPPKPAAPVLASAAAPSARAPRGTLAPAAAQQPPPASLHPQPIRRISQPIAVQPAAGLPMEEQEETSDRSLPVSRSSPARRTIALVLLVAIPAAMGGYFFWGRWKAQRNRETKKNLTIAAEQLRHDSYESYKRACIAADRVLELEPNSTAAHGYLAYAYAVRWGEHGGGDEARKLAEEHLEAAQRGGEISSHLYAADALIKHYSGKDALALRDLEQRIRGFDAQGMKSSLMYLTLGLIQMNSGDLEHARESLETSQALAPDDARIYAALGTLARRRGQDNEAAKNFEFALRYERDHPDSLLGKALLILQQDRPEYGIAAKAIRKLIESDPPPSPRQLATAHMVRALLISRVSLELAESKSERQKHLSEITGVPLDKSRAQAELIKAEETAFALDRTNPELHVIKGRRLMFEQRVDPAVNEIRQAIKMDPTRAHFYVELARALMQKPGGEKEAQDALINALKTVHDSPKLLVMLGDAYRRQGKLDEALAQYSRAVSDPKARNPEARLAMAAIYRERKEPAKAAEALEKAVQELIGQPGKLAAAYLELGRAYEDKGDRAKADEVYQKALTADDEYSPTYYYYARFLASDGRQPGKARTTAQEYLKRDPRGEYAAEAQWLLQ